MKRSDLFEKVGHAHSLELLKAGNKRYIEGKSSDSCGTSDETRRQLLERGGVPFAVIVCCSDSRIPPEIIFDVGAGQIFVIRTAGNVVDSIALGSVEYGVEHLGARLVVVLGHQDCGAVAATIKGGDFGLNIGSIVSEIQPSVEKIRSENEKPGGDNLHSECEYENIRHTTLKLEESAVLKKYTDDGSLRIARAKYILETGEVSFF